MDIGRLVSNHSTFMIFVLLSPCPGNGWAAAGMLRVLGTIQHSPFPKSFKNEMKDLSNWVSEILNAMYPHLVRTTHIPTPHIPQLTCLRLAIQRSLHKLRRQQRHLRRRSIDRADRQRDLPTRPAQQRPH